MTSREEPPEAVIDRYFDLDYAREIEYQLNELSDYRTELLQYIAFLAIIAAATLALKTGHFTVGAGIVLTLFAGVAVLGPYLLDRYTPESGGAASGWATKRETREMAVSLGLTEPTEAQVIEAAVVRKRRAYTLNRQRLRGRRSILLWVRLIFVVAIAAMAGTAIMEDQSKDDAKMQGTPTTTALHAPKAALKLFGAHKAAKVLPARRISSNGSH